jgi:hypothetical protein
VTSTPPTTDGVAAPERRNGRDRRIRTFWGVLFGGISPRRRVPRRRDEPHLAAVDWFHPQWLAVAVLIVLLSVADAFLTLTLLGLGASEINPFMAPLVTGSGHSFAISKMLLTCSGVVTLTLLSRFRAFGRLPVGLILYGVLAIYIVLVSYELWLLETHSIGSFGEP